MDWAHNEVLNLLETFAARNRCFTIREVCEWAAEPVDAEQLRHSFRRDARFIHLSQPGWGPECFLPEREMFRWWAGFNLRLATIKQPRLTERQLTIAINSLRPEGIWFTPPVDILNYGRQFGFVAAAGTPGFYVFPLAHILSQARPHLMPAFRSTFADFESPKVRELALRQKASDAVETLLSQFDQRTVRIIKGREALPPHQRSLTLDELGQQLGRTRERVRQLESRFWKRLNNPAAKVRDKDKDGSSLIPAFIAELMRRQGSLMLDAGQGGTAFVRFLAESVGVPSVDLQLSDFIALGAAEFNLPDPAQFSSITAKIDVQHIGELLGAGEFAFLAREDIGRIAAAVAQDNRRRLNRSEKAYLVLRSIGRPAHISEITNMYDVMFPGELTNERNVQGPLERCGEAVWVGTGAFALKEWGYALPRETITDTIAMIVADKYAETGRKVHLNAIIAELGRYIPAGADTESVKFTAMRCPQIQALKGDFFIPRRRDKEVQEPDNDLDDQDRKIRGFWADHAAET